MTDEEYTRRFLELLRYVPSLKEENAKIKRFINGLLIEFKERIEFDEPRSLEEAIRKLNHYYEKSNRKCETKKQWKGNAKNKGKWDKKRERNHGIGNKENVTPSKKLITSDRG